MIVRHMRMRGYEWRNFQHAALGVMAMAGAFALGEAGVFFKEAREQVEPIARDADIALQNAQDAIARATAAEDKLSAAADQQAAYWNKTSLETYKTMAALRITIVRTDQSVNDVLVPRVSASLDASTALERTATESVADTTARLDATIDALRPAIANLVQTSAGASAAMKAAGKDLSDPTIHETLAHVDGVAGNADAASRDIAAFVHRETTPARGTWNVIKSFLREFAGPAAQVATAVK
jgi:hypothetical protein